MKDYEREIVKELMAEVGKALCDSCGDPCSYTDETVCETHKLLKAAEAITMVADKRGYIKKMKTKS